MTTDPRRTRRVAGLSVRTRIAVAVALLTSVALAGAGLVVYALESARIERSAATSVEREMAEFRRFQANGVDPATGRRFTRADQLIRGFLSQNLAADNHLLVGWWAGAAQLKQGAEDDDLLDQPEFRAAVNDRTASGGTTELDTRWGTVTLAVQPVADARQTAAFLDVVFLSAARSELRRTLTTYLIVAGLSLGLITMVAAWQAGRLLEPLRTLRDEARRVTESDLSRRIPETGNDDITALTRTFNQMLGRLQAAFATQRDFLDDAGHELKTPLTVVRGHAELLDENDPREVEETRTLLLEEVDRMSRLVEDLIMLAKAHRPDFVRPRDVDVADLVATVLEKCRALGPRLWTLDTTTPVIAALDEQRITQALLQLAENAVRYTADGGTVALGCDAQDDRLQLWVRDDGPGVPDEHKSAVFERFERGPDQDDEGTGLGLSIVKVIAAGHGGTVHVEDAVPSGARFVLHLPVRRAEG
jgi:two-component system, OmpR family, sensor kinase